MNTREHKIAKLRAAIDIRSATDFQRCSDGPDKARRTPSMQRWRTGRRKVRGWGAANGGYLRGKDLQLIRVKSVAAIADNAEARLLLLTGEYIGFLPRYYAER